MGYIPWRRIGTWHCSRCGICCGFQVVLGAEERDRLIVHLGPKPIGRGGASGIKRRNGICIFRRHDGMDSLCLLQKTGLKPSACRTFPFLVSLEPLRSRTVGDSLFEFRGEKLHIYANSACPSIRLGEPSSDLKRRVLPEVAEIAYFGRKDQVATTGQLSTRGKNDDHRRLSEPRLPTGIHRVPRQKSWLSEGTRRR